MCLQSPLHQAIDHPSFVEFLLDRGADVEAKDVHGKTPLFYAVENKCDETVRLLLSRGASVDAVDGVGEVRCCDIVKFTLVSPFEILALITSHKSSKAVV